MTTTNVNISLSDTLKNKMQERVSDGAFSNPSDYVRHLIRSDIEKQAEHQELLALIKAGVDSGVSDKSATEIFSEVRGLIKAKSS